MQGVPIMSDESADFLLPVSPETKALLEQVQQDRANSLLTAFADACRGLGATTEEIMWTIAMLEARVIATFELGEAQKAAAMQFSELLGVALPPAILALERAKMAMRGGKPS
jgi:hypothetical protein